MKQEPINAEDLRRKFVTFPLARLRSMAELQEETDKLARLPGFGQALEDYTAALLKFRIENAGIGKLLANNARFRVLNYMYSLWAEDFADGGNGTFTYGEVLMLAQRGEVTPRVIQTTIAFALHHGFLERCPDPNDRRRWLYVTTRRMIDFPDEWIVPAARVLDVLTIGGGRSSRAETDISVRVHLFRSGEREFAAGIQPMAFGPEFMGFYVGKEGASLVSMAILLAEMRGEPIPSRGNLAKLLHLTKSQVSKIIEAGRVIGLFSTDHSYSLPTQALRDGHARWVAAALAYLDHHLPRGAD